tara:strand:+ start:3094 stop:3987 length:894 start_codon:yes stop_codon:yes gene_type:complete
MGSTTKQKKRKNLCWPPIIARGKEIVESYVTGVTLRQLFYRLVSLLLIPNSENAYKRLSSLTAEGRRNGIFPDLIDQGRSIRRQTWWSSPAEVIQSAYDSYRRDRTEGQDVSVYIAVEKAGLAKMLMSWFSDRGIPILALGGFASQTYVNDIKTDVIDQAYCDAVRRGVSESGRPAVLLYAGDFDPSGEDIYRDFVKRTDCWLETVNVGLSKAQVAEYGLAINPGKSTDSRAKKFAEKHGVLWQVEVDALPPETLRQLYEEALAEFWGDEAYDAVMAEEAKDKKKLARIVKSARRAS